MGEKALVNLRPIYFESKIKLVTLSAFLLLGISAFPSYAQIGVNQTTSDADRPLRLGKNSPFRDPDLFYLEADDINNDEKSGILTVSGEVEGRYEDRSLRADQVVYDRNTGRIVASGNVTLIDATGSIQYADKLELTEELVAGTATNYTGRLEGGGVVGARFVNRNTNEEFEFYNAYYTACEICTEGDETKTPSWRLRAKRVRQDKDTRTIRYNNAVLELLGVPVFYTPYLAHPDPSEDRASGLLTPIIGLTNDKGFTLRTPYYWAIDDYTEVTFSPRVYSKVNPLLQYQVARRFNTGRIDIEGSFTYSSIFDRDGNIFDDPEQFRDPTTAPVGKKLRSHIYVDGYFQPTNFWDYGYGIQLTTDDNYLNRYDLNERPGTRGIYERESRRNTSQAFLVGQDNNTRFSISTVGFQGLRSRFTFSEDDDIVRFTDVDDSNLPIIAPKIEAETYFQDPVLKGRLKAYGDTTWLTREIGTDYGRATAGLEYTKTWIAPGGLEIKPFGNARVDYFDLTPDGGEDFSFSRTLGQVGADIRYPFINSANSIDWIIEPRVQVTQSFGDARLDDFFGVDGEGNIVNLSQDGTDIDLDPTLLWNGNKGSGYDVWEKGFRADIGASFSANWNESRAHLFLGQSYSSGTDNIFDQNSGLDGATSDLVGMFELEFGRRFSASTRVRFDEDQSEFRRIDSRLEYRDDRFFAKARYYRVEAAALDIEDAPPEELSGDLGINITKNWSTRYKTFYDIDNDSFRRHSVSLTYEDDCTLIELFYNKNNITSDAIRDNSGFGIRVALSTLGDTGRSR